MKKSRTYITGRAPRPDFCRGCNAEVVYQKVKRRKKAKTERYYRITKHLDWCPLINKDWKPKPGDGDKKIKYRRPKEKDMAIIPLSLAHLPTVKFERVVNQYLRGER